MILLDEVLMRQAQYLSIIGYLMKQLSDSLQLSPNILETTL